MSDDSKIPDNVDLNWVARRLIRLQHEFANVRDDISINTAAIMRLDATVGALTAEFRAMRSQRDRLRRRVDALEELGDP